MLIISNLILKPQSMKKMSSNKNSKNIKVEKQNKIHKFLTEQN